MKGLKDEFLNDLWERDRASKDPNSNFSKKVRKVVKLDEASDLILDSFKLTLGLRDTLNNQEEEFQKQAVIDAHLAKLSKLTNERLDFYSDHVIKR